MNSTKYIIEKIKEIHSQIEGVTLVYAYEKATNYHIIEVSPENIRRGSNQYIEIESILWNEFFEKFPNENILISDVNEDNDMSNHVFSSESIYIENYSIPTDEFKIIDIPSNSYFNYLEKIALAA